MKKTTLILAILTLTTVGTVSAQIDRGGGNDSKVEKKEKPVTTQDKEKMKVERAEKAGTTTGSQSGTATKQDRVPSQTSAETQARAKEMTDKMDEVLNLTTEQYQKAMQVNLKYVNQLEEMKSRNAGNAEANKEQMKAKRDELSRERLNQYKSFLTAEQWRKFEERRGEMKEDYQGEKGGGSSMSKEEKKERMENMTPEEKQKMQEKKEKKSGGQ